MNSIEKLEKDLHILEKFLFNLADYVDSETLFYPTGPNVPDLTLGGWFMRQHRLLSLRKLLGPDERNRLEKVIIEGEGILRSRIVASEKKMHHELDSRLRQWTEYLRDLREDASSFSWYATAVEARVMLSALIEQLELPPYQMNSKAPGRLSGIDELFRVRWIVDDFVWPEEWKNAYPKADYWYLHGTYADSR